MTSLQEEFTKALQEHLTKGEEAALLSGYELGRKALADGLGVLDVATLLHEALVVACRQAPNDCRVVEMAEGFILECLSPFEMAHRGAREANTALRGLNDLLEEQTRRISHALHDQAGQLLASVYLALDEFALELPTAAQDRFRAIRKLLDRIEEQLRRLSHELRPTILDDVGLVPALEFLAEGVAARTGLRLSVEGPHESRFPGPVETVLYRVVQEALTNVSKHAQATSATIHVWREGQRIYCSIRDDGVGFDPEVRLARGASRGIGLLGIRERLAPLGGGLRINAAPGVGTELLVTVPFNE